MSERYLWNKADGPPDPFIQSLERALATKRYGAKPVIDWRRRLRTASGFAAAAMVAGIAVWFGPMGAKAEARQPTAPVAAPKADPEAQRPMDALADAEPGETPAATDPKAEAERALERAVRRDDHPVIEIPK